VKWTLAVMALLILVCTATASAQKFDVKIVDRQDKEDEYAYAAVYNNVAVGKSFKVHTTIQRSEKGESRLSPSLVEVEIARRVLKTLEDHGDPSHADTITLRLCIGARSKLGLGEIVDKILEAKYPKMRRLNAVVKDQPTFSALPPN
jgi:hypothetical protein